MLSLTMSVSSHLGVVETSEFLQVVRDHDLNEATGDGYDFWPRRCLQILRAAVVGRLGRGCLESDAELAHENDFFSSSQTDAEVPNSMRASH